MTAPLSWWFHDELNSNLIVIPLNLHIAIGLLAGMWRFSNPVTMKIYFNSSATLWLVPNSIISSFTNL
jgi:hypothetical protein